MKAASVAVALLSAAGALAQSGTLTINTPLSPVVCEPLLITWSGGTPPYFLSILPGGQPTASPVLDFGEQTGTSITWVVNATVGESLGLDLRDSTGALAQSAPFTIQSGPSTSCLTGGSSSSASGATSSASGSTPAPATTPATTPANTPTTPANTPTTPATIGATTSKSGSSSSSPPSTSTTAKSGAISVQAASGLVTAVGAALVALVLA